MTADHEGPDRTFIYPELVVVLLFYGTIAGGFWTAVIIAASWLTDAGYGALAVALVGIWLLISAPVLYAQAGELLDVVGRTIIGHVGIVPRLVELTDPPAIPRWMHLLGAAASVTAPGASLSALALYALEPPARPFALIPFKTRLEVKTMAVAVNRLRNRA